jgi:hypothetical protein
MFFPGLIFAAVVNDYGIFFDPFQRAFWMEKIRIVEM